MKYRTVSVAASLGSALVLIVACGGSSFEAADDSAGGASGAMDTGGTAGKADGGSASGGTTSGGRASAGTSSGGASNGGVSSGGVSSGGASSGGVSSGGGVAGAPAACNEDSDCVACAYPTAPKETADCYCASCPSTPLSKTACAANKTAWEASCAQTPIPCPGIACVLPPVPQCKSHKCVAQ